MFEDFVPHASTHYIIIFCDDTRDKVLAPSEISRSSWSWTWIVWFCSSCASANNLHLDLSSSIDQSGSSWFGLGISVHQLTDMLPWSLEGWRKRTLNLGGARKTPVNQVDNMQANHDPVPQCFMKSFSSELRCIWAKVCEERSYVCYGFKRLLMSVPQRWWGESSEKLIQYMTQKLKCPRNYFLLYGTSSLWRIRWVNASMILWSIRRNQTHAYKREAQTEADDASSRLDLFFLLFVLYYTPLTVSCNSQIFVSGLRTDNFVVFFFPSYKASYSCFLQKSNLLSKCQWTFPYLVSRIVLYCISLPRCY